MHAQKEPVIISPSREKLPITEAISRRVSASGVEKLISICCSRESPVALGCMILSKPAAAKIVRLSGHLGLPPSGTVMIGSSNSYRS